MKHAWFQPVCNQIRQFAPFSRESFMVEIDKGKWQSKWIFKLDIFSKAKKTENSCEFHLICIFSAQEPIGAHASKVGGERKRARKK